jgi:hypothetical protein
MNKKPDDAEPGAQPCRSADYLRSYPVDCSRQFIHVIKPGEITFAGQGGMHTVETDAGPGTGIGGLKAPVWHSLTYSGGRPSSRPRVREEAMRRLHKGQYSESPKEFGEQLSGWLARLEQAAIAEQVPQMTPRIAERNVRDLWDAWHRCRGCRPAPWR